MRWAASRGVAAALGIAPDDVIAGVGVIGRNLSRITL
jgi:hypothetical protein